MKVVPYHDCHSLDQCAVQIGYTILGDSGYEFPAVRLELDVA